MHYRSEKKLKKTCLEQVCDLSATIYRHVGDKKSLKLVDLLGYYYRGLLEVRQTFFCNMLPTSLRLLSAQNLVVGYFICDKIE